MSNESRSSEFSWSRVFFLTQFTEERIIVSQNEFRIFFVYFIMQIQSTSHIEAQQQKQNPLNTNFERRQHGILHIY